MCLEERLLHLQICRESSMSCGCTTLARTPGRLSPVVATSQVFTGRRAQPQQATCLVDAGELVPDAISQATYGCSEDLAAIRQVPAVQTCCSTTYGSTAAANGLG